MIKFISLIFLVLFTAKICCAQYNENFGSTEECYGKTFSISAWVLTDTTNSIAPIDLSQVLVAIDSLNQKFKSICVDFKFLLLHYLITAFANQSVKLSLTLNNEILKV